MPDTPTSGEEDQADVDDDAEHGEVEGEGVQAEEEVSPELALKLAVPVTEMPITFKTLQMLATLPTTPERFRNKPRDMLAVILVARELGVSPMSAINNLYLVDGDVAMKGKLMSALVHRAGHQLRVRIKETEVTVTAFRRDPYSHELQEVGDFTFGNEDAERAGLAGKPAYQNFPTIMWSWRAISSLCRFYFSDVLEGVGYVPDDLGVTTEVEIIPDEIGIDIEDAEVVDAATAEVVEGLDAEQIPAQPGYESG